MANPRGELRLGMYADVALVGPATMSVPVIPRSAAHEVGSRQIVYLVSPNEPGTFIERDVRQGQIAGQQVEVLSGLYVGDKVVAEGSFFPRRPRQGL